MAKDKDKNIEKKNKKPKNSKSKKAKIKSKNKKTAIKGQNKKKKKSSSGHVYSINNEAPKKKPKRSSVERFEDAKKRIEQEEKYESRIKLKIIISILLGVVFALCLAFYIILNTFEITTVIVEGNEHYTDDQIAAIVQEGKFGDNSLYLSYKYHNKSITDVPFVQSMDVEVLDRHTIKVSVYEKKLAGFVEYLGKYMYFDKDGIVVETSDVKTAGIPMVTGLDFDHFTMYEALPVENDKIFKTVLNVTQLLNKYEIETDKIYFDSNYEMTLYFKKVRVQIGDEQYLEEKIQMLTSILPQLEGKKGVLNMKSYDEGLDNITFTLDGK